VSGAPSLAHVSGLPQQTVVSTNGLSQSVQSLQPIASISSVVSQQPQVMPFSDENSSVQQQSANGDRCLNSSDNTGRCSSHSSQLPTEACQNSVAGLSHLTSVEVLRPSRDVSEGADSCSQSQPADISQPQQLEQSAYTDDHSGSESLTGPTCTQSTGHSHVIEQLQHQLLQSSARQAVNGCRVTATTADNHQPAGEEGEVDSNELMQFLS